jgi:pimeloyl-ACP methyl ester carboxylesterase
VIYNPVDFIFFIMGLVKRALRALIRPSRFSYNRSAIPFQVSVGGFGKFLRFPVTFTNRRGERLVGSVYSSDRTTPFHGGPCVLYLHGNAASQLEAQFLVPNLCPHGIFVASFDFAGCGCSDGDYLSLGKHERDDAELVLNSLTRIFGFESFVVWGRSRGAATALLVHHPPVVGRVCDSPFTSVRDVCKAFGKRVGVPKAIVKAALWYLRRKVRSKAHFDFTEIAPIETHNGHSDIPILFGHAANDAFIPFEHSKRLYEHYPNPDKTLLELPGGHNTRRDADWILAGVGFCLGRLRVEMPEPLIFAATTIFAESAMARILA